MKWIALLLLCSGIGVASLGIAGHKFTTSKLQKMEMIRGIRPGATNRAIVVTDKLRTETALDSPTYWIAWNNVNIQLRSNERLNLMRDHWNSIETGDTVILACVKRDSTPYHPEGIFASDGNMMFDKVLLGIEVAIALLGVALGVAAISVFVIALRKQVG